MQGAPEAAAEPVEREGPSVGHVGKKTQNSSKNLKLRGEVGGAVVTSNGELLVQGRRSFISGGWGSQAEDGGGGEEGRTPTQKHSSVGALSDCGKGGLPVLQMGRLRLGPPLSLEAM